MSFTVTGTLHGQQVALSWYATDERDDRLRLIGDSDLRMRVEAATYAKIDVSATPTGPIFTAALDPPHVALVTILAQLDPRHEADATGDVPTVPGLAVPDGATA